MVLEDITNTTASYSQSHRPSSLARSSLIVLTPGQQNILGIDDKTEESRQCSAATLLRRRSRLSYELLRRLSNELLTKRRRESLSVIDSSASIHQKRKHRDSSTKPLSVVEHLAKTHAQDQMFSKGYSMEDCIPLTDIRLVEIHNAYRDKDSQIGSMDQLIETYAQALKASILKFLDTVIGYLLYVQHPSEAGVTSGKPLDLLLALWVMPSHQDRNLEDKLLRWWIQMHVRSVKYFSITSPSPLLKQLLQKEGMKKPSPQLEDCTTYISST